MWVKCTAISRIKPPNSRRCRQGVIKMELPAPSELVHPHIGRADGTGIEQVAHDAGRGVAAEIFSHGDNALVTRGCVED